ncbi:MAG TPA: hypothetical protein DCL54_16070 [Alphaproteobacteria bacterium]|nr:hypothetical protein [Alphaproteobacteria bacterium]HAJ48089.1 hypothetical protein [Alphaproteobacteria bacterium]
MMREFCLALSVSAAIAAPAMACPKAAIIPQTNTFVQMGAGGDPNVRAYDATMSNPTVACEQRAGALKLSLSIRIDARLAPNVEAKPVQVPYFVAIQRKDKIIAKEIFPARIGFSDGKTVISVQEQVDRISVPIDGGHTANDMTVLTGFQLSREQLRALTP